MTKKIHYAWVIVFAGCLTIFACIGLARFSYGMLLPSMGKGLALGYDRMGYIGTGNFIGYLTGVSLAPYLLPRIGARVTTFAGLLLISVCMWFIGTATEFYHVLVLYLLTGVGSGLGNIPIMVVIGRWFDHTLRGRATGFMLVGNSLAIILSGFLIPNLNQSYGDEGWRMSWAVIGSIVFVVAIIVGLLLRDDPKKLGLSAACGTYSDKVCPISPPVVADPEKLKPTLFHLAGLYFAFGVTHVIYVTFLVTSIVSERGISEASAGKFWAWVGFFGLMSGPFFGGFSDRFGRNWGLAFVFVMQTAAYLLAALGHDEISLFASIMFYGLAAWAVPTIIAAAVADSFPPEKAAGAFSFITFCLALAQIIGPSIAGNVAKSTHTFSTSFLMSAVVTTFAIFLSIKLGGKKKGA